MTKDALSVATRPEIMRRYVSASAPASDLAGRADVQKTKTSQQQAQAPVLALAQAPRAETDLDSTDATSLTVFSSSSINTGKSIGDGGLASEPSDPERAPAKRSVSFGTISVREYARILGDNPSASAGPPISLSWDYISFPPQKVDSYESLFSSDDRRTKLQMLMHPNTRRKMLRDAKGYGEDGVGGYSNVEMKRVELEIQRVSSNRKKSHALSETVFGGVEEVVESLARKLKRGQWRSGDRNSRWWEGERY